MIAVISYASDEERLAIETKLTQVGVKVRNPGDFSAGVDVAVRHPSAIQLVRTAEWMRENGFEPAGPFHDGHPEPNVYTGDWQEWRLATTAQS